VATSPASSRASSDEPRPLVVPFVTRFPAVRRLMFRTLSQTSIRYRESDLSAGAVGSVAGGDRLPWVRLGESDADGDNYATLDGREWQVHVYGEADRGLEPACRRLGLRLVVHPWRADMDKAGLSQNALVLLRPDGHVALVDAESEPGALEEYFARTRLLR
jgi:hypothetical protein